MQTCSSHAFQCYSCFVILCKFSLSSPLFPLFVSFSVFCISPPPLFTLRNDCRLRASLLPFSPSLSICKSLLIVILFFLSFFSIFLFFSSPSLVLEENHHNCDVVPRLLAQRLVHDLVRNVRLRRQVTCELLLALFVHEVHYLLRYVALKRERRRGKGRRKGKGGRKKRRNVICQIMRFRPNFGLDIGFTRRSSKTRFAQSSKLQRTRRIAERDETGRKEGNMGCQRGKEEKRGENAKHTWYFMTSHRPSEARTINSSLSVILSTTVSGLAGTCGQCQAKNEKRGGGDRGRKRTKGEGKPERGGNEKYMNVVHNHQWSSKTLTRRGQKVIRDGEEEE